VAPRDARITLVPCGHQRFCASYAVGRVLWAVQQYSPGGASVHPQGPHVIRTSLDPPESKSQTASRSVRQFLHSSPPSVPMLYNGPPLPLKIAPSRGYMDSHLIHGSLGLPSPQPKRHVDRFNRFCRAHCFDRPTDRATRSVTIIGHICDAA